MSRRAFSESATVVVAGDVLASEFGSEYVLLNLKNGTYYSLDNVGADVWKLVQTPLSVAAICDRLVGLFEVDRETCRRDVVNLINELAENGLVEIEMS